MSYIFDGITEILNLEFCFIPEGDVPFNESGVV